MIFFFLIEDMIRTPRAVGMLEPSFRARQDGVVVINPCLLEAHGWVGGSKVGGSTSGLASLTTHGGDSFLRVSSPSWRSPRTSLMLGQIQCRAVVRSSADHALTTLSPLGASENSGARGSAVPGAGDLDRLRQRR